MRIFFISYVLIFSLFSPPVNAFWWWAGSAVKHLSSDDKKHEKNKKKSGFYYEQEHYTKADGYNNYHKHPDGEVSTDSMSFNEKPEKGW